MTAVDIHPYRERKKDTDRAPQATGPLQKKHPYYDYQKLLSYNGVYNFLVGGRGLGKTYGAKRLAIKRFLQRGDMFIYLRRYTEELKARNTFFADIQHEFPDWDFRAEGNVFQVSPASDRDAKKREWQDMGYIIPLSTAQKQKSVAFPRVKLIIFDEFIIEKGAVHYLPDEANVFNNFYSTVDRWQDKTTVLFLANAVSITNPYFIEYGIMPEEDTRFLRLNDGFVVCHFPKSSEFEESVKATRFGRFIADTDYAAYAIGNEFNDGHRELVGDKNARAKYMFTLETRLGTFSLWHDMYSDQYYALKRLPGQQNIFTLLPERMSEEKLLLEQNDLLMQRLRTAFRQAKIVFDSPGTRNMFVTDVFRRT